MTSVQDPPTGRTESEHWSSYSGLTTFRACPQRWNYSSVQHLSKIETEPAAYRDFGSWWHTLRAAEALARGRMHDSLKWAPKLLRTTDDGPEIATDKVIPVDVIGVAHAWWKTRTTEYTEDFEREIGATLPDRLESLWQAWLAQWADQREHERPLAVELKWVRALPALPQPGGEALDPSTSLVGYIDEVYFDERRVMVVVRDHKANKGLSTQTTADDMMDSQLQLYAWGAAPTVKEWGLGPIRAVAYDRARSVAPHPPSLTLSGRLKQYKGQPTLGMTDLATYLAWCSEGVPFEGTKGSEPGLYYPEPSVVEKLSSPSHTSAWFQRTLTPLNEHLVRTHLRAAVDSALDQQLTRARIELTGEAARNLTNGCRWCDFAKLCRAQMVGGPDGDYSLAEMGLRKRS